MSQQDLANNYHTPEVGIMTSPTRKIRRVKDSDLKDPNQRFEVMGYNINQGILSIESLGVWPIDQVYDPIQNPVNRGFTNFVLVEPSRSPRW